MAFSFKPVERSQLFLLPPDMSEWLPADHLVWFLIDAVEVMDTSRLHKAHKLGGRGRQAYNPDMMLVLLFYAYCAGERSSRRIEQLCETDIAFRVVTGGGLPDHSTIARFRQASAELMSQLFAEILMLLEQAGMVKVGVVAIDGTKMAANASKKANRTAEDLASELARLQGLAETMMSEAEAKDAEEDALFGTEARGDERTGSPSEPEARRQYIKKLYDGLVAAERERAAAEADRQAKRDEEEMAGRSRPGRRKEGEEPSIEELQAKLAKAKATYAEAMIEWRPQWKAAKRAREPVPTRPSYNIIKNLNWQITKRKRRGPRPANLRPPRAPKRHVVNVTDPDSRIMKSPDGWVQGFNAQAAVTAEGVIVAAFVTNEHTDSGQYQPVVDEVEVNLKTIGHESSPGVILADAGYFSTENLARPGPDRLISDTKARKLRAQARTSGYLEGDPPPEASLIEQMHHKMRTRQGAETYALRQQTIEPVFGDIKENKGFRRFSRRGKAAASAEWKLICGAKNLLKLYQAQMTP